MLSPLPIGSRFSSPRAATRRTAHPEGFRALNLRLLLCVLAILFHSIPLAAQQTPPLLSQYAHTAWEIQDGSFPSAPITMAQTPDGFLWIGTETGLLRFDGVRFDVWGEDNESGPFTSAVTALKADRFGNLWVGMRAGGIFKIANGRIGSVPKNYGHINEIVEGEQGDIWYARSGTVGDDGPLCHVQNDRIRCYGTHEHLTCADGEALTLTPSGMLWMASIGGICSWNSRTAAPGELQFDDGSHAHAGSASFAHDANGTLWLSECGSDSYGGLKQLQGNTFVRVNIRGLPNPTDCAFSTSIDRRGDLWLGTRNQGLYRIRQGKVDHYDKSEGLSSNGIKEVLEDREGNTWVLTSLGLDRFATSKVLTFSSVQGMDSDSVHGVAASYDGSIWTATDNTIDHLQPSGISSIRSPKLPDHGVMSVMEDDLGRLWTVINSKVFVRERGKFRRIDLPDGKPITATMLAFDPRAHEVWAVYQGSRTFRISQSLVPLEVTFGKVYAISPAPGGGMWGLVAGPRFAHFEGEKFVLTPINDKRTGGASHQLMADSDGSVFSTTAKGISRWSGRSWSRLGVVNGLPCEDVYSMIRDSHNGMWLATVCGIVQISSSEFARWEADPQVKIDVHLYDQSDGVVPGWGMYAPTIAKTKDGRIWFAQHRFLQMIDPANIATNALAPSIEIQSLIADHLVIKTLGTVKLQAAVRDVEINYTAPSLSAPQKVHFKYRLSNVDRDWNDAGTRRQAFYMGLKPGTYHFQVIASNNDGIWNLTGATTSFTIPPTITQTVWFRLLAIFIAIAAVVFFFIIRLRRTTESINSHLSERVIERERIARELHDTLLQGFHGVTLRFQTAASKIPAEMPARAMMESALDRADEVLLEGRERVRDLRSEELDQTTLRETFEQIGLEAPEQQSLTLEVAAPDIERPLHPIVRDEVYRIGREAIQNARSHSKGTRLVCTLSFEKREFRASFADDGEGIPARVLEGGGVAGHWGLGGMRERAATIGAELSITSTLGSGTVVEVRVPAAIAYRKAVAKPWWGTLLLAGIRTKR